MLTGDGMPGFPGQTRVHATHPRLLVAGMAAYLTMTFIAADAAAKDVRKFSDDAIDLKLDCVAAAPDEGICAMCIATASNRLEEAFSRGDITISIRKGKTGVVKVTGDAKKVLPKGSAIMNDEKNARMKAEDHIVQALKDKWKPGEELKLQAEIMAEGRCGDVEVRARAAGRPKSAPATIYFTPANGPKDQQGLPVVSKTVVSGQ
jgi:hypothetical protein